LLKEKWSSELGMGPIQSAMRDHAVKKERAANEADLDLLEGETAQEDQHDHEAEYFPLSSETKGAS